MENLLEGDFHGALFAVNPNHRRVLGQRSYRVARRDRNTRRSRADRSALRGGAQPSSRRARARAPRRQSFSRRRPKFRPTRDAGSASCSRRRAHAAFVSSGPHAFGVIRTSLGLNATVGTTIARRGRLALIAQSGAVCTAMLDFAASVGIGFSTVIALGGGIDVGFGELLDAALNDPETDGILLVCGKRRRRPAIPVGAARGGTHQAGRSAQGGAVERAAVAAQAPSPDEVFDAAMKRAGAVRVKTYVQLFAAARILAMNRIARGDRLAIVTNGRGPATLAADVAADRGIALAEFSRTTELELARVLPPNFRCRNPLDLRAEGTPQHIAAALDAVLADPQVDAVLALHVARPLTAPTDAARAVAAVAHSSAKPVLGAWLGAVDRREVDAALEAGGVGELLSAGNRRRGILVPLGVPPPSGVAARGAFAAARAARAGPARNRAHTNRRGNSARRTVLTVMETHTMLASFGLPVAPAVAADTLSEALQPRAASAIRSRSRRDAARATQCRQAAHPIEERLRDGRMLTRAWARLLGGEASTRRRAAVIVRKALPFDCVPRYRDRRTRRRDVRPGDHARHAARSRGLRTARASCCCRRSTSALPAISCKRTDAVAFVRRPRWLGRRDPRS